MRAIYKSVLINYTIIISIIIFVSIYLLFGEHINLNNLVILTFIINLTYVVFELVINEKKDYSFKMIFFLFNLIFLCISAKATRQI